MEAQQFLCGFHLEHGRHGAALISAESRLSGVLAVLL
jgi:hypothetical protein